MALRAPIWRHLACLVAKRAGSIRPRRSRTACNGQLGLPKLSVSRGSSSDLWKPKVGALEATFARLIHRNEFTWSRQPKDTASCNPASKTAPKFMSAGLLGPQTSLLDASSPANSTYLSIYPSWRRPNLAAASSETNLLFPSHRKTPKLADEASSQFSATHLLGPPLQVAYASYLYLLCCLVVFSYLMLCSAISGWPKIATQAGVQPNRLPALTEATHRDSRGLPGAARTPETTTTTSTRPANIESQSRSRQTNKAYLAPLTTSCRSLLTRRRIHLAASSSPPPIFCPTTITTGVLSIKTPEASLFAAGHLPASSSAMMMTIIMTR